MDLKQYKKLLDFLQEQLFFKEKIASALKTIPVGKPQGLLENMLEYSVLLDALTFEPDEKGITPFDYFLKNAKLTPKEKQFYTFWKKHTVFSIFEVTDMNHNQMQIKDIIFGRIYHVFNFPVGEKPKIGSLIMARLLPQNKTLKTWIVLSGSSIDLPEVAIDALRNGFSDDQQQNVSYNQLNELEFILYVLSQAR